MSWIDWAIVIIPLAFVMYMAYIANREIRCVADFLAAGRVCGRYVICVADVANGLAIITLVASVEINYKTGFAMSFWSNFIIPLSIILSLTGYCIYRFRETRSMSLGQFLEMRYSRNFRIFAAALRSVSEMLANMICPAVAARFFIYLLDLPQSINIWGLQISTFGLVIVIVLTMAISIICAGGTLALVITDTIQGLMCYPMLVIFTVFVLWKFSWSQEIVPVMTNRAPGESFLNPYDISQLRDFNLFALMVLVINTILNYASWTGAGNSSAARNPHEQKMASVLGSWRAGFSGIFYLLIAVAVITLMNHPNYAPKAEAVRSTIINRVAGEVIKDEPTRLQVLNEVKTVKLPEAPGGVPPITSQANNNDTPYLENIHHTLQNTENGNGKFQEFRTLYHQVMLPISMRELLPTGLLGLFCLLMVVMMVSTDDTRIFSSALTLTQDVILPFRKTPLSPRGHIRLLRLVSIGVGVFFFAGAFFMSQLDYISLFGVIMTSIWLGGAGPVMIFGLYSRFGTAAGAWASLLTGMSVSLFGIGLQRNWADYVYPWLEHAGMAGWIGTVMSTVSRPLNPYVVWEMNPVKFPVNSVELSLIAMLLSLTAYITVSLLTCRKKFNLEEMLHRGKYRVGNDHIAPEEPVKRWRPGNIITSIIGITPEYTRGDRLIAKSMFFYSIVYQFVITFLLVVIWNLFSPWPMAWWSGYFLTVSLIVPGIVATISTVWFSICGYIDLRRLFRDLRNREIDPEDDGRVSHGAAEAKD